MTQTNEKKPLIEKKTCHIWAFLNANTNTNTFEKNKKIQIGVKILPKNVFENTKTNTFNLYEIFNLLHSDFIWCVLMFSGRF